MKLLVCESRTYSNERVMRQVIAKFNPEIIIHGGCRGADELAHCVANKLGIYVQVFEADWKKHGKAAGPIRNKKMLNDSKPDLVVAFFDRRRTKGTMNMIKLAKQAYVPIQEYGLGQTMRF